MDDFIGWLLAKAREFYEPLELRMYMASVIGQRGARSPFGTRTVVTLPRAVPTKLMENQSRNKAMLGYIELSPPVNLAVVALAASPTAGPTSIAIPLLSIFPSSQDTPGVILTAIPATQTFVLRPSEEVYGTCIALPSMQLRVTTEYF
jgi:hypothetical protein